MVCGSAQCFSSLHTQGQISVGKVEEATRAPRNNQVTNKEFQFYTHQLNFQRLESSLSHICTK